MDLLQMCIEGSAMIAVVIVARALLFKRLPKAVFYALWCLVLLRLLVPVAVPVPVNGWTLIQTAADSVASRLAPEPADDTVSMPGEGAVDPSAADAESASPEGAVDLAAADAATRPEGVAGPSAVDAESVPPEGSPEFLASANGSAASSPLDPTPVLVSAKDAVAAFAASVPWEAVWAVGAVVCGIVFAALYVRAVRRMRFALLTEAPEARGWLAAHPLRRRMCVKEMRGLQTPLTYGVLRPVVIVPTSFDWRSGTKAAMALEHEYVHICRFDPVLKILLILVVCLYWFDPLVWVMYVFANRDIEFSCDERVVRQLNDHGRAVYAHTLIDVAEAQMHFAPVAASFGGDVAGRVVAVMDVRRPNGATVCAAVALAAAMVWAFGTVQIEYPVLPAPVSVRDAVETPEAPGVEESGLPLARLTLNPQIPSVNTELAADILTPRYRVLIPTGMFAGGFDWSFSQGSAAPAPDVATDTLVVTSKPTGEVAFVVYCCPADGEMGQMPGYVLEDCSVSRGDRSQRVVLAVPEATYDAATLLRGAASGRYPSIWCDQGSLALVYGLDGEGLSREAFVAYAEPSADGQRVVVPSYAVDVPQDLLDQGLRVAFEAAANGIGDILHLQEPGGAQVTIYARPQGSAGNLADGSNAVDGVSPLQLSDGSELVVYCATVFSAEDGSRYQSVEQAQERVAFWLDRLSLV